jgi:hypothetical protein
MDIMGVDPNKLEILSGPVGSAKRRCPNTSKMLRLTGNDVKHTELTETISNICCNLFDEK